MLPAVPAGRVRHQFGTGISREGSLLDVAVELGLHQEVGAWFTYEGEQLGQGRENVKTFLQGEPPADGGDRRADPAAPGRGRTPPRPRPTRRRPPVPTRYSTGTTCPSRSPSSRGSPTSPTCRRGGTGVSLPLIAGPGRSHCVPGRCVPGRDTARRRTADRGGRRYASGVTGPHRFIVTWGRMGRPGFVAEVVEAWDPEGALVTAAELRPELPPPRVAVPTSRAGSLRLGLRSGDEDADSG